MSVWLVFVVALCGRLHGTNMVDIVHDGIDVYGWKLHHVYEW